MPPHSSWMAHVFALSGQAFYWTWAAFPTSLSSAHEIQCSASSLEAIDLSSHLSLL